MGKSRIKAWHSRAGKPGRDTGTAWVPLLEGGRGWRPRTPTLASPAQGSWWPVPQVPEHLSPCFQTPLLGALSEPDGISQGKDVSLVTQVLLCSHATRILDLNFVELYFSTCNVTTEEMAKSHQLPVRGRENSFPRGAGAGHLRAPGSGGNVSETALTRRGGLGFC